MLVNSTSSKRHTGITVLRKDGERFSQKHSLLMKRELTDT
ncbi:hypothetical protein DN38_3275 [Vibrio cholerae]|nr:hypothetical protein DN38_3275 [Vibrio cholerae]